MWYRLASANGDVEAQTRLDCVARVLSEAQRGQAEQLTAAWRALHAADEPALAAPGR